MANVAQMIDVNSNCSRVDTVKAMAGRLRMQSPPSARAAASAVKELQTQSPRPGSEPGSGQVFRGLDVYA